MDPNIYCFIHLCQELVHQFQANNLLFLLSSYKICRKIFRLRLEVGDHEADIEQRRVEVAIRDNAQRLYASKLKFIGRETGGLGKWYCFWC
ncbi:protein TIC110, chloroplastic-like [Vicia villosa]|uniref:protein TIC110, chloroplastic-like n=1 Tax=Vicia villosa TaxID=3911 RepID=UPI00273CBA4B|nr:protein TIC110, chloroplastic-like [Vicia villosa]